MILTFTKNPSNGVSSAIKKKQITLGECFENAYAKKFPVKYREKPNGPLTEVLFQTPFMVTVGDSYPKPFVKKAKEGNEASSSDQGNGNAAPESGSDKKPSRDKCSVLYNLANENRPTFKQGLQEFDLYIIDCIMERRSDFALPKGIILRRSQNNFNDSIAIQDEEDGKTYAEWFRVEVPTHFEKPLELSPEFYRADSWSDELGRYTEKVSHDPLLKIPSGAWLSHLMSCSVYKTAKYTGIQWTVRQGVIGVAPLRISKSLKLKESRFLKADEADDDVVVNDDNLGLNKASENFIGQDEEDMRGYDAILDEMQMEKGIANSSNFVTGDTKKLIEEATKRYEESKRKVNDDPSSSSSSSSLIQNETSSKSEANSETNQNKEEKVTSNNTQKKLKK